MSKATALVIALVRRFVDIIRAEWRTVFVIVASSLRTR